MDEDILGLVHRELGQQGTAWTLESITVNGTGVEITVEANGRSETRSSAHSDPVSGEADNALRMVRAVQGRKA